jgi:hypothetical protein
MGASIELRRPFRLLRFPVAVNGHDAASFRVAVEHRARKADAARLGDAPGALLVGRGDSYHPTTTL